MIGPDGRMMVWVGLNIVSDDADTGLVVIDDGLLCVNVNDDESLGLADRIARERGV
jgi:GTP:adenosylcobinamide-phosphate guanylyltransferase